jgi:hypothetical protein
LPQVFLLQKKSVIGFELITDSGVFCRVVVRPLSTFFCLDGEKYPKKENDNENNNADNGQMDHYKLF